METLTQTPKTMKMHRTTPRGSHRDKFGRLYISRKDRKHYGAIFSKTHGLPENTAWIHIRDQWIAQQVRTILSKLAWKDPI